MVIILLTRSPCRLPSSLLVQCEANRCQFRSARLQFKRDRQEPLFLLFARYTWKIVAAENIRAIAHLIGMFMMVVKDCETASRQLPTNGSNHTKNYEMIYEGQDRRIMQFSISFLT